MNASSPTKYLDSGETFFDETAFKIALAIDPSYVAAINNRANALTGLAESSQEEPISYSNNDKIFPSKDTSHYFFFVSTEPATGANTKLELYQEALVTYDRALKIDPNDTDVLTNKGKVLYILEKYQECMPILDHVLEIDPNHVGGLYYKGKVLEKTGKIEEASTYTNKALEIDPSYAGESINIETNALQSAI